MQFNTKALLATGIVTILLAGSLPATADGDPPAAIGKFVRLGMTDDLTEDSVTDTASGVAVDAPTFSSNLKVDLGWIEERVGDFSTAVAFHVDGQGRVVVPGQDTEFRKLEIGDQPVFTLGSKDSIRFEERPMWLSVEDMGENSYRLEMDDGDTSGQTVYVSKKWLFAHGIHRPDAVHEDGSNLTVTVSPDGLGYLISVPHFSWVILSRSDLDVRGWQNGQFVTHAGLTWWNGATKTLKIDVPLQTMYDYQVWVERDWFRAVMPDAALQHREWAFDKISGAEYLVIEVPKGDTPTSLVFEPFSLNAPDLPQFTAGNMNTVFAFNDPLTITVRSLVNGDLRLDTRLPGEPGNHTAMIGYNTTWLASIGITVPEVSMDGQAGESWGQSDGLWYYAIPTDAPVNHVLGNVGDPVLFAAGGACNVAAISGMGNVHTFGGNDGSHLTVWAAGGFVCFSWHMEMPPALYGGWLLWYTATGHVSDGGDSNIGCSFPTASSNDAGTGANSVVNADGVAACDWPDGEEINDVLVVFHGLAIEKSELEERYSGHASWTNCYTGAASTEDGGTGPILLPAIVAFAIGAVAFCYVLWFEYALYHDVWDDGREAHTQLMIYEWVDLSSGMTLELVDPNARRTDTWDRVEYQNLFNDPNKRGNQELHWTVTNVAGPSGVGGATGAYHSDISRIKGVTWDHHVTDVIWVEDARTFQFNALQGQTTFTEVFGVTLDWEASEDLCMPAYEVWFLLDDVVHGLGFGDQTPDPPCDPGSILALPVDSDLDTWITYDVISRTVSEDAVRTSPISIGQGDLDFYGSLPMAMVHKALVDPTGVGNITSVEPSDEGGPMAGGCGELEFPHEGAFDASASGQSMADALPKGDTTQIIEEICFMPLVVVG